MPTNPSYSMMHSLQDSFSIVLYSKTNDTELSPEMCSHQKIEVRLILPEHMVLIWNESTCHGGAKSRTTTHVDNNNQLTTNAHHFDMRFFGYI